VSDNLMCDGSGPHGALPVRVLPLAGNGNLILCNLCHGHELRWRRERNRELSREAQFDLPAWESLTVYDGAGVES